MGKEIEHINHALVAKAHTPMYLMHKFWARKPHNVVREYIEHYSKPGDIVLDPFVGSGVTALEAIKADRKAVAIDLDSIATFITKNTAVPVDLDKLKETFEQIREAVKNRINELYETKCPKCKNGATVLATIFNRDKNKIVEVRYYCNSCKKRGAKNPDENDLKLLKKIEKNNIPYQHPTQRFYYNSLPFMKKEKIESVDQLFTRRNLVALSVLFNYIEKIKDKKIKELFEFTFTSMVHLASKMCPVAKPGGKGHWSKFSATSFWALQSYWTPPIYMESNVWMLFDNAFKFKQGLLKGKGDSNAQIKKYKTAKKFDDLKNDANILIKTYNALELTDIVPENSIDYIFTDPPYGGAVQYFELSTLWTSWLKMELDYRDEITINKNQRKSFEYYHKMLKAAFRQMFLVLKPRKYLTVTFHSTDIKVWNSIVRAVILSGFELEKIIYQPPARPSAKGLLQPFGSAVGDYYIRFRKPKRENQVTEKQMDMKEYELIVVEDAMRIIGERREPTMYQHILNGIMVDLKGGKDVPIGAKSIEEILKENVSKKFEMIPVKDEKGKTIGKKWWVRGWDLSHFSQPTLSDRVERAIIHVLDKKVKVSFDDILQSIFIEFPNAQTPDTQNIKEILEEYAKKTKDGKWMLKPGLDEVYRKTKHSEMIYYLALLGKKAGYEVLIGLNEQKSSYAKTPLSKLSDKVPAIRYVPQEEMTLSRIRQIDVLWLEDGRLRYEFEVENTTGITGAIVRGSNIPTDLRVKRFIVIPKERENLLYKRMQEPIIQQSLKKDKWSFIRYHALQDIFDKYKSKRKFDPEEMDKIAEMPRLRKEVQNNLSNFVN